MSKSTERRSSRYVQGGLTDVYDQRLGWWERYELDIDFAKEVQLKMLSTGKDVVTANKALLAEHEVPLGGGEGEVRRERPQRRVLRRVHEGALGLAQRLAVRRRHGGVLLTGRVDGISFLHQLNLAPARLCERKKGMVGKEGVEPSRPKRARGF